MNGLTLPEAPMVIVTIITAIVAAVIKVIPDELQSRWKGIISFFVSYAVIAGFQLTSSSFDFSSSILLSVSAWLTAMGLHAGLKSVGANK